MNGSGSSKEAGRPYEVMAYDSSMRDGVVALLCEEYGGDAADRAGDFGRFYEHSFQREAVIRIVAVDNSRIIGFQSVFAWPYTYNGRSLRTYQSGNSIIAKDWRGRGLFGSLLRHLNVRLAGAGADALIGFPVAASLNSFLRSEWQYPGDLRWHARPVRMASALREVDPAAVAASFDQEAEPIAAVELRDTFSLSNEPEFLDWRRQFRVAGVHCWFHHTTEGRRVRFDLKVERRGRMCVLVIGGIAADDRDPRLLSRGLSALVRAARANRDVALIAIAINREEVAAPLLPVLRRNLFLPVAERQKVRFIVKPLAETSLPLGEYRRWRLMRGDVDTW